ncbi:MAG: pyrroloquinoline quinone-dependent dehydrogenase, partial [Acidobacteria bacterium]
RKRALEKLTALEHGPLFTPLSAAKGNLLVPGIAGGANWGGAGFDRESGVLYVPSRTAPTLLSLVGVDPKQGDMRYVRADLNSGAGMDSIDGLPIIKPPYSRLTAIDLNRGEHLWMAPLGSGPRDHPLLKDLNLPPLGDRMQGVSVLVTKTLVIASAIPTAAPSASEATRRLLFVFDKQTGAPVHTVELDAFSAAAPMTYMHRGKQYIVVATGSGPNSELVALSLP